VSTSIVNDIRNFVFGLAEASVYGFCKSRKQKFVMSFTIGTGRGVHMHWHIFPRRAGDTPAPGPVWQLGSELNAREYYPDAEELENLKARLSAELDKLLES